MGLGSLPLRKLLLWGFTIGQGGYFLRRSFLSENSREKGEDKSFTIVISTMGEQGRRSGENARLPPMCPGFDVRRYSGASAREARQRSTMGKKNW